jgi:hypothetical protein
VNGGLGFDLAKDQDNGTAKTAYIAIAAIVWVVWLAASIYGEWKRRRALANAPPKYTENATSPMRESEASDGAHADNGHYAPAKNGRTV